MKLTRPTSLAAILLSTTCKILPAAPPEQIAIAPTEADFFTELPVVLSVTRLRQNQHDVPGFVTVIDAEDIRHSGARDLAELLRSVPGFQVAFNAYGAPVAGYHGLTDDVPKGLQVLIDGRSQYSPLFRGGVGWSILDVPLEEIERIEVLRGSNSPAYGSNAFMGVVNVITRHASDTKGWLAKASNGNQGIQDRLVRFGFGGKGWGARISASTERDDGEPRFFDSRKTERVNFRADIDVSASDSVRLLSGLTRVDIGTGFPPDSSVVRQLTDPRRQSVTDTAFLQADWRHLWSSGQETALKAYRIHQRTDDDYQVVANLALVNAALSGTLTTDMGRVGEATRDDFELQHTADLGMARLVGGLGWRRDVAEHGFNYGPGRTVSQTITRLFGQAEFRPVDWLTANLGATHERDSNSGSSTAPRGGLNIHLTPQHTVKMVVAKSRRLPSLHEKFSNERVYEKYGAVVNPGALAVPAGALLNADASSSGNIKPEEVLSKEVGYLGEFRQVGLTMDARFFREQFKNRIQAYDVNFPATAPGSATCPVFEYISSGFANCGTYSDYFNVIDATIRGWEAQLAWKPTTTTDLGVAHTRVEISTRWTATNRALDSKGQGTVDYLANSSPSYSTAWTARQRFLERFTVAASYYDVGAFQWTQNGKTDAYRRLDWRLAYDFRIAAARAELAWTVRNDGRDHAEWWSRNLANDASGAELIGTRHFVSLRVEH